MILFFDREVYDYNTTQPCDENSPFWCDLFVLVGITPICVRFSLPSSVLLHSCKCRVSSLIYRRMHSIL